MGINLNLPAENARKFNKQEFNRQGAKTPRRREKQRIEFEPPRLLFYTRLTGAPSAPRKTKAETRTNAKKHISRSPAVTSMAGNEPHPHISHR
jgi:hypothetical protein